MVNSNGLSCKKDLSYLNPMEIDFMIQNFLAAEDIRMCSSISHQDAINSTNMGADWWQRYAARSDGGSLV